jgi:hypothetical protein
LESLEEKWRGLWSDSVEVETEAEEAAGGWPEAATEATAGWIRAAAAPS